MIRAKVGLNLKIEQVNATRMTARSSESGRRMAGEVWWMWWRGGGVGCPGGGRSGASRGHMKLISGLTTRQYRAGSKLRGCTALGVSSIEQVEELCQSTGGQNREVSDSLKVVITVSGTTGIIYME